MIAEQLKAALRRKEWSITAAAEKSGVDRSFLSRLLSGQDPPRTRDGRETAEHDERYWNLAKALDLDAASFVATVARVQKSQPAVLPVSNLLNDRHSRFKNQIDKNRPLRHKPDLVRLMSDCLSAIVGLSRAKVLTKEVLGRLGSSPPPPSFMKQPYVEYDYLGLPASRVLERFASARMQTCREIGDALVELDAPYAEDVCIEVAMLFYDLAVLDHV